MSVTTRVRHLTRNIAHLIARTAAHPVRAAGEVADLAEATALGALGAIAATGSEDDRTADQPAQDPALLEPFPAPIDHPAPTPARPPVATEPKPAGVDDWHDEIDGFDDLDDAEDVVPEQRLRDGEHLIDPAVAKSVRHESEMLRRAADRRVR